MGETREAGALEAIRLVALGPLPDGFAFAVAARLSRSVAAPCAVHPDRLAGPWPFVEGRAQVDADRLLLRLESMPAARGVVWVGLTALDLAVPIFTFVFGRARRLGRAALVSTARLDGGFYGTPEAPEATLRRAVDEVRHELGHVAGLLHCPEAACLMRFAAGLEQVEARGSSFCPGCSSRLPPGLEASEAYRRSQRAASAPSRSDQE
jgi:archaemetzincin